MSIPASVTSQDDLRRKSNHNPHPEPSLYSSSGDGRTEPRPTNIWPKCMDDHSCEPGKPEHPIIFLPGANFRGIDKDEQQPPLLPTQDIGTTGIRSHFVKQNKNPPMNPKVPSQPEPSQLALALEVEERKLTLEALRENNNEIKKILATLKVLKAEVLTLDRTFTHIFEDLTNEMLLILISLKINKIDQ
ncbi:hypothetical protein FXO37_23054 [Capsicum annuum]|nr:hypothetical protein FXO37_23054 [Capsicum annuum]